MVTELGKVLRKIRLDRSEILYHMAKSLGYGPAFLSGIENGKQIPDDFREKLFEAYSLTDSEKNALDRILKKDDNI